MFDEQARLVGVGVVVVDERALLQGHLVLGVVVVVMRDDGDVGAQSLLNLVGDGGLAAARAACDADDHDVAHDRSPVIRACPMLPVLSEVLPQKRLHNVECLGCPKLRATVVGASQQVEVAFVACLD